MAAVYDGMLAQLKQTREPAWSAQNEKAILDPYTYLTSVPGKEIRGQLIDAFNAWLRLPQEVLTTIKFIVAQLHTASLMMDDVEDASELRRGIPVAHKIYGVPQTINSANYVYFLAFQKLFELQKLGSTADLAELVTQELLHLHRGQGLDIFWRDQSSCPTEAEYVEMVNNKTGGLLRIGIKLMQAAAAIYSPKADYNVASEDLLPLVNLIGIWFQIRDDYMNLQSDQYAANKGFAEDLTEGKFSFPVVHAIRQDTSNMLLVNILRQKPTEYSTKAYAVEYMRSHTKSFDYTRDVMKRLSEQAYAEVARLGGNPALEAILGKLDVKD